MESHEIETLSIWDFLVKRDSKHYLESHLTISKHSKQNFRFNNSTKRGEEYPIMQLQNSGALTNVGLRLADEGLDQNAYNDSGN